MCLQASCQLFADQPAWLRGPIYHSLQYGAYIDRIDLTGNTSLLTYGHFVPNHDCQPELGDLAFAIKTFRCNRLRISERRDPNSSALG
jgi:hypothetical protein